MVGLMEKFETVRERCVRIMRGGGCGGGDLMFTLLVWIFNGLDLKLLGS